jgi:hypothetical protein
VLLFAAEGGSDVGFRLQAVVREKCGNMTRMPFFWRVDPPALLRKGAIEELLTRAREAEACLLREFGLPLGLIGIDTLAACAGFTRSGDENDNAAGAALMGVLNRIAQELKCFVLGIDHFGKDAETGTRGASAKEASADLVLACLGDRQVSGSVSNTRLAVRKLRQGRQGDEHPFSLHEVVLGTDEDDKPITSAVLHWLPAGAAAQQAAPTEDLWIKGCHRDDQRAVMSRLKRALFAALAEHGEERPVPSTIGVNTSPLGDEVLTGSVDAPAVRMVEQELVRKAFDLSTPASDEDSRQARHVRFTRARDRALGRPLPRLGITITTRSPLPCRGGPARGR